MRCVKFPLCEVAHFVATVWHFVPHRGHKMSDFTKCIDKNQKRNRIIDSVQVMQLSCTKVTLHGHIVHEMCGYSRASLLWNSLHFTCREAAFRLNPIHLLSHSSPGWLIVLRNLSTVPTSISFTRGHHHELMLCVLKSTDVDIIILIHTRILENIRFR